MYYQDVRVSTVQASAQVSGIQSRCKRTFQPAIFAGLEPFFTVHIKKNGYYPTIPGTRPGLPEKYPGILPRSRLARRCHAGRTRSEGATAATPTACSSTQSAHTAADIDVRRPLLRWARSAVRVTQSGQCCVTETNSLELIVGNDSFLTSSRSGLRWIQSGLRKMKIFDFEIRLCTSGDCRAQGSKRWPTGTLFRRQT